jgi:hypothetical protein
MSRLIELTKDLEDNMSVIRIFAIIWHSESPGLRSIEFDQKDRSQAAIWTGQLASCSINSTNRGFRKVWPTWHRLHQIKP